MYCLKGMVALQPTNMFETARKLVKKSTTARELAAVFSVIFFRVSAMSGKSGKCLGIPFPYKTIRELSGNLVPFCNVWEMSR